MEKQLSGKTVIVTGANCGIGYETALELVKRDAHAILSCRSEQRGKEAVDKIKAETKSEKVELELLDLASLKSVRAFADRIKAKCKRLDILINNAASTPSRIINVSSVGHKNIKINWDDLNQEKSYSAIFGYQQSKLANCLFTIELARRLKDTGVVAVSLHPGIIPTEIWRDRDGRDYLSAFFMYLLRPFIRIFGKSVRQGASTTIHCAISNEVLKQSGLYFDNCEVSDSSPEARDQVSAEKLWMLSEKFVELK